ncbi:MULTISPECIES: hypothetical protein [Pseudofrankia]|uniref:hypothetical protein n=1 Tax=Pseudofrankia TaxID=2994363 RepID=UPI000234C31D|nr:MULTISPECIES: hypothetical protein [Pseudofrankia]OHV36967.1 hypothetical protein BCD49_17030 [Pseudofrankia sp. EUN1h]
MESTSAPDPGEASAALDEALRSQARLTANLRLPSWFFGSIAVAIAGQILTTATGLVIDSTQARAALAAGLLLFALVATTQVARFRRTNGVWIHGLVSRVVLGSATTTSLIYAAALAGSLWAGYAGHWWLSAVCAAAGGAGYAASGTHWLRLYRTDPQTNTRAESLRWAVAAIILAVTGLLLLILGS